MERILLCDAPETSRNSAHGPLCAAEGPILFMKQQLYTPCFAGRSCCVLCVFVLPLWEGWLRFFFFFLQQAVIK